MNRVLGLCASFLALSRPWAWFTIALLVIAAQLNASYVLSLLPEALLSGLAVALVVSGGFALNDYADRELDAQVHPKRHIPSGKLTPSTVLGFALLVFIVGLSILGYLGTLHLAFGLMAVFLLGIYSPMKNWRGLVGNTTVALLLTLAVIYGYATGNRSIGWETTVLLALTAFFSIFSREIVKDVEDMRAEGGRRITLPMQLGCDAAYRLSAVVASLGLVLCLTVFLVGHRYIGLGAASPLVVYWVMIVSKLLTAKAEHASEIVSMMKIGFMGTLFILVMVPW